MDGKFKRCACLANPLLDQLGLDRAPNALAEFVVDRVAAACEQRPMKRAQSVRVLEQAAAGFRLGCRRLVG